MFSLKTQEEREEDRTGRMGGGGDHRAGRYVGYKKHDGAPAF